MTATNLSPLQVSALLELQSHGGVSEGKVIRVDILEDERERMRVRWVAHLSDIEAPVQDSPPMPNGPNGVSPFRHGREFSPTEEAILAVMTREWQTKVEISEACMIPQSSQFCALLTNLVDREYLESSHRGYRLRG